MTFGTTLILIVLTQQKIRDPVLVFTVITLKIQ
jgi:hypothetical protein